MNNKMTLGIVMMLTASLSVALLSIPSKVAIARGLVIFSYDKNWTVISL
jgi:hypothetical protein